MRHALFRFAAHRGKSAVLPVRRYIVHIIALCLLGTMIWAMFTHPQVHAIAFDHTSATVDVNCKELAFSPDGNPFPLCPGPFPTGGNCVWWAWEQWHLLGYDLPLNWGNAAEWVEDAERFGLPVGTRPRLGSIAVFPVADGVWAFGPEGHVAFVTWVSQDQSGFNVTYQNYGDPTPMHIGTGYNVSVINEARYQDGQLRFIYFPGTIDPARFSRLQGVDGNNAAVQEQIALANSQLNTDINAGMTSHVSLGLPPGSYDQRFDADFTGTGLTDLLLYNRQKGSLDVLTFAASKDKVEPGPVSPGGQRQPLNRPPLPRRVSLGDSITPVNGWGSSLDVQIGDFTGSGRTEILLYDRLSGTIQLLSLSPQLKIAKHVVLPGWGPGWEVYAGQFDGHRNDLFLYSREIVPNPTFQPTPVTQPTTGPTTSPSPKKTPKPSPTPKKTPGATPTPSPKPCPTASPTPTPSPTASPTVSPSPTPCPTASPTPTPTSDPSPSPTPSPDPTHSPTPSPTVSPSPTHSPTPSPTPSRTPSPTATTASSIGAKAAFTAAAPLDTPQKPVPGGDLSGNARIDTQSLGLTPNIMLVSFKSDFSIDTQQEYTLMYDSWEVYIGRFDNPNQDGLFLYDRVAGEARIMDFTRTLLVNHYQSLSGLDGNWDIHTGDFNDSGRAQVLLYDPGTGYTRFLAFAPDLSSKARVNNPTLLPGRVLYVGHFGLPSLSVMLYDPTAGRSTFYAFDTFLAIHRKYSATSLTQRWQILIGSFLDRSACIANHTCAAGDDVLALNRKTGQVQQFIFTFGNQYHVFDNRSQAFLREGAASTPVMNTVNASSFEPEKVLNTGIFNDELY